MIKKDGKDYRRVTFRGFSMYPFLRPGDVLVLAAMEPRLVKPGDIVCVDRGRTYVTHRVIDINQTPRARILTLKGDNLLYTDPPFSPGSGLLLKVTMIIRGKGGLVRPRFGKLVAFLSRNNLTPGIIGGRIGRVVRGVYGRFLTLLSRTPGRTG
jgi:hypothetical protein